MDKIAVERADLRRALAGVDEHVDALRHQLTVAETEREKLAFGLSLLERIAPAAGRATRVVNRKRSTTRQGGTSTFMLKAVAELGAPVVVEAIVDKMRELGWESETDNPIDAVRAALSRALREGLVTRPQHGKYGPLTSTSGSDGDSSTVGPLFRPMAPQQAQEAGQGFTRDE